MAIKDIIMRFKNKTINHIMKEDTVLFLITIGSSDVDKDIEKLEGHSDAYHKLMSGLVAYVERNSKGELTPARVRDEVSSILGDESQVFVVKCDKFSAAWYMAQESCDWIKKFA